MMKEFQLSLIRKNTASLLIGQPGRGLHQICNTIVNHIVDTYKIPNAIVISNNKLVEDYYVGHNILPDTHTTYQKIIDEQARTDDELVVIFDGSLIDTYTHGKDMSLNSLFDDMEHHGITVIVLTDSLYNISPCFRSYFNYVFVFGFDSIREDYLVYNNYASIFSKYEMFYSTLYRLYAVNKLMVINRRLQIGVPVTYDNTIFYMTKNK